MAWAEKRDEIDKLKQKAREVLYPSYSKKDPWNYTEEYEARSSLEWTIKNVMTEYNDDWDKDYEFQNELEYFLSVIAEEHCSIRENFGANRLYENVVGRQKAGATGRSNASSTPLSLGGVFTGCFLQRISWIVKVPISSQVTKQSCQNRVNRLMVYRVSSRLGMIKRYQV